MNWKWEDKVDSSREKQRVYEERKRLEFAQAKRSEELRQIERNLRAEPNLAQLRRLAEDQARREADEYRRNLYEMQRYYYASPTMFGGPTWGSPEVAVPRKQEALPEDHVVQALTGYRAWNVPLFVDELRSVAKSSKWKPYQRFEAFCESAQCQGVSCSCGIYAFKKMESVQAEYKQEDRSKRYVYGECHLWGRVLECKDGYRAQFAYPKAFINNGAIAKRMAEVFGVALLK
jgi:hypothetical protein